MNTKHKVKMIRTLRYGKGYTGKLGTSDGVARANRGGGGDMSIKTLTMDELHAIPYELTYRDDGTYMTAIDHDEHDADDCDVCDAELDSICASLPAGWWAEWTGNGNGTESDVSVFFRGVGDDE